MKKSLLLLLLQFSLFAVWGQSELTFHLTDFPVLKAQRLGIRGSIAPLSWEKSLFLDENAYITIPFDATPEGLEYKYVLESSKEEVVWEMSQSGNRILFGKRLSGESIEDQWNVPARIDIDQLPPISPAQLQEDLALLQTALLQVDPASRRYQDAASWDQAFREAAQYFEQERSYEEVYLQVAKLVAQVRCGHTLVNQLNQDPLIKAIVFEQADKLPFAFQWIDERMIVTHTANEDFVIQAGTEILSINGVPVREVLHQLMPYVSADGANDGQRIRQLQVNGYAFDFEAFDAYFPLLFPARDGHYLLEYQNQADGPTKSLSVAPMLRLDRNRLLSERYPDRPRTEDDLWDFRLLNDDVALLKLGTFGVWHFTMDWQVFIDDAFREVKKNKVQHLIIDIRDNAGGADQVIEHLGKYLLREDCLYENLYPRAIIQKVPAALKPYVSTWDTTIYDQTLDLKPIEDGFYTYLNDKSRQQLSVSGKAFRGQVYLLGNETNSSATYYLRRIASQCQMATIVGTPSGGNQNGINGGTLLFLRLPHSKVEIDIPVVGMFSASPQPDAGLPVDVLLKEDVASLRLGKDAQLEGLLDYISGQ